MHCPPPYTQMIVGHSQLFWISVRADAFPELTVGSGVQIECMSPEIVSDTRFGGLEAHPTRQGVLRAVWKVKAVYATPATGLRVRVGPIAVESAIEVLATEADRYRDVAGLQFAKKKYHMTTDQKRKQIRVLAPLDLVRVPTPFRVEIGSPHFGLSGAQILQPDERLHVAKCDLAVTSDGKEASGLLRARLGDVEAAATVTSTPRAGSGLSIKIVDIDLGNQRYRWRQNVLEIAARHPSLSRYLGSSAEKFPGQDSKQFRVVFAEVVADAVCALLVGRQVRANPEEYEDADWDAYYSDYSRLMTSFLPTAHKLQCPEV